MYEFIDGEISFSVLLRVWDVSCGEVGLNLSLRLANVDESLRNRSSALFNVRSVSVVRLEYLAHKSFPSFSGASAAQSNAIGDSHAELEVVSSVLFTFFELSGEVGDELSLNSFRNFRLKVRPKFARLRIEVVLVA